MSGYGGVFCNSQGEAILIFERDLGIKKINVSKFHSLEIRLDHAIQLNFSRLIMEGDSKLVIYMIKIILNGIHPNKVSQN